MIRRAAFALILALAACSKPPPPPLTTVPAMPSARDAGAPDAASSARPGDDEVPDPAARKLLRARLEQPAIALAPATKPPRVTAMALANSALDHTADMKPDADIEQAVLAEGQRASLPVTMAAGECVTFVAQGGLGVIELDLFLTSGQGADLRVLAEDPSAGPIAVVGGRGHCFHHKGTATLDAELHVMARRGGGVVLVRRFRR